MSPTSKTIVPVVAIVVIVLGIGWFVNRKSSNDLTMSQNATANRAAEQNSRIPATTTRPLASPSYSDTSDTSINSDIASIDSQMKGLSTDSSTIAPTSDNQ